MQPIVNIDYFLLHFLPQKFTQRLIVRSFESFFGQAAMQSSSVQVREQPLPDDNKPQKCILLTRDLFFCNTFEQLWICMYVSLTTFST